MSLKDKINEDFKVALKAKEASRVSCLRMLKSSVKNMEVEKRRKLKDEEIQSIISSLIRKGNEAIQEFKKGGRDDLVSKEEQEIKILYGYLPQQLSPKEIEKVLKEVVSELDVTDPKDLGKVMKVAMARMTGQAQGKEVNEIARRLLS